MILRSAITGWGMYVPDNVVTNHDLAESLDTSDEWIRTRTGIRERRIATEQETTATMAIAACARALEQATVSPEDVDLVLVATCTPDNVLPATASLVQAGIGAVRAGAFDLNAVCSGFVYAMTVADAFIRAGIYRTIVVAGSETISRIVDWTDRATCVLFGDGAGALVMQASEGPYGVVSSTLGSDGWKAAELEVPAGGSRLPASQATIDHHLHFMRMNGREVYRFAVNILPVMSRAVVEASGWQVEDVDLLVAHQANIRIIEAAARTLGIPDSKVFVNVDKYGNTSAASIPIALCEAHDQGLLREGTKVVVAGFGAGLSWASCALVWGPVHAIPRYAMNGKVHALALDGSVVQR